MRVIVTAGGTSEKIDEVRKITNMATGQLGALIATEVSKLDCVTDVYYICEDGAALPSFEAGKTLVINTQGVLQLKEALEELLSMACEEESEPMDVVIHSMAISDYMVESVDNADGVKLDRSSKISSNEDRLTVTLVKTPKVIDTIKTLSPDTHLIGFKLLDHVPHDTLIDTAYQLLQRASCDLVLANDLVRVSKMEHIGFLVAPDKTYVRLNSKKEIAVEIAKRISEWNQNSQSKHE